MNCFIVLISTNKFLNFQITRKKYVFVHHGDELSLAALPLALPLAGVSSESARPVA